MRSAFETCVLPIPAIKWQEIELPCRYAGLGLRSSAKFAPLACIAASIIARPLLSKLIRQDIVPMLCEDPCVSDSLSVVRATFSAVMPLVETVLQAPRPKCQRLFTDAIERAEFESRIAELAHSSCAAEEDELIRLRSNSAPFAAAWITPLRGAELDACEWMELQPFRAALRLRLGLPVVSSVTPCAQCGGDFDVLGRHALVCRGTLHARHNAVRDGIFRFATGVFIF